MLDRGAARPSTTPGPGPRAGRCAAPAPPTANARRDPGPIVGSPRRLGWGRGHDASRPGGSGAGTARRRAPRPAFSGQTLRAYSPGPACSSRGLATFNSSHRAKLCALPPLRGPERHPEERRRADEVLVRRLHSLEKVRTAQTASLTLSRAKRCADRRFCRSLVSVRGQGMRSNSRTRTGDGRVAVAVAVAVAVNPIVSSCRLQRRRPVDDLGRD
jgi:hypothetical protein